MVGAWLYRLQWVLLLVWGLQLGRAHASPEPTSTPTSMEKPIFGTPAGPYEVSDNFVATWVEGQATDSQIEPLLEDLESAWEALVVDAGWPLPPSADGYRIWVVVDSSLGDLGATSVEGEEVSVPVIRVHPDVLSETSVRRATTAHEFHHAIQLGLRTTDVEEELWFSEASATWAEGQVWPQNPNRWDAAWGYMNQPGLPYDAPDTDHAKGMWLLVESLHQHGHSVVDIWEQGRSGEDWLAVIEESTGQEASLLWVDFTATVLSGVYGQPQLQGELADDASGTLSLLGTHYWVNPGPDAVGVEVIGYGGGAVVATNATGQIGGVLRVQPGRAVAVTAEEPDSIYWIDVAEAPPSVGVRPESNEDEAGPVLGPSSAIRSSSCAHSRNAMGGFWLWVVALATIACFRRGSTVPHSRV